MKPILIKKTLGGPRPLFIFLTGALIFAGLAWAAVEAINFQSPFYLPAGRAPYYLQAADFDGDGRLDLAVANRDSGDVTILYLEEDPYTPLAARRRNYKTGEGPFALFAADLDRDGDIDLATADMGDNALTVLLNQGEKTFSRELDHILPGTPYAISGGDLDGDGDIDLVVAHVQLKGNENPSAVTILENLGKGKFHARPQTYPVSLEPRSVSVADLDGDNYPEIITANKGNGSVTILFNDGKGNFSSSAEFSVKGAANSVFVADLDGNQRPDLAVATIETNAVAVLLNQGKRAFGPPVLYNIGLGAMFPFAVAGADLDEDGDVDLVTANLVSDNASVLLNDGKGIFQVQGTYEVGNGPRSLLIADLNGDHHPDVALANRFDNKVSVLLQKKRPEEAKGGK